MSKKIQRINTPIGEVRFSYLDKPRPAYDDKGKPKFEITLRFKQDDPDWKKFCTEITGMVKAIGERAGNPIHWETEKDENDKKVKTGFLAIRFATGEQFKPAVFDAYGRPLPEGVRVGNGSMARVNCNPAPYEGFGGGITMYLNAVQITELIPYGASSDPSVYNFEVKAPPPPDGMSASESDGSGEPPENMGPADESDDDQLPF